MNILDIAAERRRDELLEMLWRLREHYESTLSLLRQHDPQRQYEEYLTEFANNGMIRMEGERILLTAAGEERARNIVRRHRLAERLIVDVLGRHPEETEEAACEFEHLLAPELVDAICTLLGHPKNCPHGSSIPEGACCRQGLDSVATATIPLAQMAVGEESRIAFLNTSDPARMNRLMATGLVPGIRVLLRQRYPAIVIDLDRNQQLAFEASIGQEVRVWRNSAEERK